MQKRVGEEILLPPHRDVLVLAPNLQPVLSPHRYYRQPLRAEIFVSNDCITINVMNFLLITVIARINDECLVNILSLLVESRVMREDSNR